MSRPTSNRIIPRSAQRVGNDAEASDPTTDELAEALLLAVHALQQHGHRRLEADPVLRKMSMPRARVLMVLEHAAGRPVRMSDLAAALGVTARNVTTIVDGLEHEGYVARRPDPTDRRATLLELTDFGCSHIDRVQQLHCQVGEAIFAPLDIAERRELVRLLRKIGGASGEDACQEP